MANQTNAKPTDFTGKEIERLTAAAQDELKARAGQISMIHQQEEASQDRLIDVTQNPAAPVFVEDVGDGKVDLKPVIKVTPVIVDDEIDFSPVEVTSPTREMRVNQDVDQMTFGVGNHYDFKVGKKYKVPSALYDHLNELGYVWH